jgi:MOSC domain-containing protein YiiM
VVSIHVAATGEGQMQPVERVEAVAGKGLIGDRYFLGAGTYSKEPRPDRQVTLIESEALEALARDYKVELEPGASRRNITTRGVALNHLVGREFSVGPARLRGIKLCEPCNHLEAMTGREVRPGLVHRGGLRCEILSGGEISVGDSIQLA